MALKQTLNATGVIPMAIPAGSELVAFRMAYTLTADLAANDIIEMGSLPANCKPVDLILDTDDLGTTGAVSVGLLNSDKSDISGTAWSAALDVNTAATGLRATAAGLLEMSRVAASGVDRPIGIKITTDTTATSGVIGLTLMYRATR